MEITDKKVAVTKCVTATRSGGNRLATTTDAAGNTTKYVYDANTNVLLSVEAPNGATTSYTFAYGAFALRSSIKVGGRTPATCAYTSRNNYLASLDYGNGDSVDYTYDDHGRLVKQTYEDGDTVTYQYDNNGALATVTDSATGITTTYYYMLSTRKVKNGAAMLVTDLTYNN